MPQGWSRRCSELGRRASQRAPQRRGRQRRRERIRGGDVAGLGLGARSERVVGRRRIRRHRRLDRIDHLGEEGRGAPRARGWLRRREAIWDCVGAVRGGSRRHGRARARRFVRWCSPRPTAPEARRGAWHTEAQPLAGATHERWRWRWRVGGGAVRFGGATCGAGGCASAADEGRVRLSQMPHAVRVGSGAGSGAKTARRDANPRRPMEVELRQGRRPTRRLRSTAGRCGGWMARARQRPARVRATPQPAPLGTPALLARVVPPARAPLPARPVTARLQVRRAAVRHGRGCSRRIGRRRWRWKVRRRGERPAASPSSCPSSGGSSARARLVRVCMRGWMRAAPAPRRTP